ncbi:MAG: RNA polymerase sigma factor [Terricaulis sp.]
MMNQADAELIAAARRGEKFAFARLMETHQQGVRGFLRRACGNADEADDLAQETFLSAWERLAQFRGESSLRSWLCGIAYKKMLAARRSSSRSRVRDHRYFEESDQVTSQGDPSMNAALQDAMKALPVDQRACVALCLAAGYSHAEAAEALEMPLGTVKSHVNRGRERLLAALGECP